MVLAVEKLRLCFVWVGLQLKATEGYKYLVFRALIEPIVGIT